MEAEPVAVFGGTGYLGRYIVRKLMESGFKVRVAARHLELGPDDPFNETFKDVEKTRCDIREEHSVEKALEGCSGAVNSIGLYIETSTERFKDLHEEGAERLARLCRNQDRLPLVHLSGIGADEPSKSAYVRSRGRGDARVLTSHPDAVILRPSAVFSPDDDFVNALARLIRQLPVFPLFGDGSVRLQPVYAGDVANAVTRVLSGAAKPGATYELGGAEAKTFRDLAQLVMDACGIQKKKFPVPYPVWDILAAIASVMPGAPPVHAMVALMKQDNVVAPGALSLADLGVTPTRLEDILPQYVFN